MTNVSRQVRRAAERTEFYSARRRVDGGGEEPPSNRLSRFRTWGAAFLGAGATGLVVALVIETFGQAGLLNMANAYAMLAGAWAIATLTIAFSKWIWGFPSKHRIALVASISMLFGIALIVLGRYEYEANYELTHLVSDDRPTPKNSCRDIGKTDLLVFLGDDSVVARPSKFPFTIIEMGRDRKGEPLPLLIINKTDRGISIKTLRIFNGSGKLGTKIDSDAWIDNSNFHSAKINPHELVVRDDQDEVALNLDYINPRAIKITGIFRHPMMYPLEITPKALVYNNVPMVFGCVIAPNARAAYFVDGPRL